MQDFCCQKKLDIIDVIPLDDDGIFTNRRIVIGFCSNCKKVKYNLIEYNTIKLVNVYNRNKPKRIKNINQLVCTSDNPEFDKIILKGDEIDSVNIVGRVVGMLRNME